MATRDDSRTRRRRLRTAAALAIPPLSALLFLATPSGPMAARASTPAAPKPTHTIPPTCAPDPCQATPTPCDPFITDCPASPSPDIIVISPVPLDSPSPATTPSYLLGIPSPSIDPGLGDVGTPIPLAGGFNARSPGPVSAISDSQGGGGIPGPLLLIGIVVLVGGAGALLFAVAPKGERFPERVVGNAPGFLFTPYGPDSPELMVMEPGPDPSPPPAPRAGA